MEKQKKDEPIITEKTDEKKTIAQKVRDKIVDDPSFITTCG